MKDEKDTRNQFLRVSHQILKHPLVIAPGSAVLSLGVGIGFARATAELTQNNPMAILWGSVGGGLIGTVIAYGGARLYQVLNR